MRSRLVVVSGALVLLAVPLIAELASDPFLVTLFTSVAIFALAAVSLDFILGYGAMVSLGHAAFFGLGGYTVGILAHHAAEGSNLLYGPLAIGGSNAALLSLPLAALVAAAVALVIGAICLRTSGVYFIMITLAFAQMLFYFFVTLPTYGGDDGLSLWGRNQLLDLDLGHDVAFYYLCLALLFGFTVLCRRIVDSRFGMVMRGCRENERRMRALGFATYRYKLVAFSVSGAGAGLAGALMANNTEFVSPAYLAWFQSGEILIMVLLGGMGTLYGPILGAAALILLEEVLVQYTEHWMLILGPLLIVVVLFARGGLFRLLAGRGSVHD